LDKWNVNQYKIVMKNKRLTPIYFGVFIVTVLLFLLYIHFNTVSESSYIPIKPITMNINGQGFSGSASCIECHKDIYLSHLETAHFNTSRLADSTSIKGDFFKHNRFILNDEISFSMNTEKSGFYQEAIHEKDNSVINSNRIDIVLGSGTKGQTYLNWKDDELYQLQISYFEPNDSWVNSPGYPEGIFAPNRPIGQRCLECHVTYAESKNTFNKTNEYYRSKMIYGIDCERCHGPALEHANHHLEYPNETEGKKIKLYSHFSQKQKLQACALCHSGVMRKIEEQPFSFIAGDTVNNDVYLTSTVDTSNTLDVHGNQYGLLIASSCFKKSKIMDCSSCHNPHENQRNNFEWYNSKCVECHQPFENNATCTLEIENRKKMDNNCVECHMPLIPSKSMSIYDSKDSLILPVQVRTHFIGIY